MAFLTEMALGFGRIVATKLKGASNAVLLSVKFLEEFDDPDSGESSTEEPMFNGLGLYGRPLPPTSSTDATPNDPKGECEIMAWKQEDITTPMAYRDLRLNAVVNPDVGEIGIAHYGGGFISAKLNATGDGTDWAIYSPHKTAAGVPDKASIISMDSTDANRSIAIVHAEGQNLVMTSDALVLITNAVGDAYIELSGTPPVPGPVGIGAIVINAPSVAITGGVNLGDKNPALTDFVALAAKVATEFAALKTAYDSHTHPDPMAGITGIPAPLPTAGDVGALLVKAI